MRVFDNYLGNWIQIIDNKNEITIEKYRFDTGIIEGTTDNHCVKCVAVNKCIFKNENGKKPEKFNTTGIDILDFMVKNLTPGLYHINCHCEEVPINLSSPNDIELIIPNGKIPYMFKTKRDWVESMGYHEKDFDKFVEILLQKAKEAYFYGEYYIESLNNYGCKANFKINIPGTNEKLGKVYKIESNYMIFPNGKLKMNTPMGGWQK